MKTDIVRAWRRARATCAVLQVDQRTEIARMQRMLAELTGGRRR